MKWTLEIRKMVFSRLAKELGREYRKGLFPWRQREKEIVQEFAEQLNGSRKEEITPEAVLQQVDWAFDNPKSVNKSHVMVFCQCKVAAHEAGLIGPMKSLPVVRDA
jgi:hypothetical protein